MRLHLCTLMLAGCLTAPPCIASEQPRDDNDFRAEIAKVATITKDVVEETKKARNARLNELFREYVQSRGEAPMSDTIKCFNALLKERGLTSFDDFLAVQTAPLRYVKDPLSGDLVPVFGPLGSDVVNSWLAEMEIGEGKPLAEQPMYRLARDALSEHLDFSLSGIKDPRLSLEMMPEELRENAKSAYQRLNPTNEFEGGFDHPLFYATVREAARKLFREDHPQARLSMADVVLPEEQGGFGIRSCLLCHDRNHTDVYKRVLGQGLLFKAKASELRHAHRASSASGTADVIVDTEEIKQADAQAGMLLLAARRLLDAHPDKIDAPTAERSLAALSSDNLARYLPGYNEFHAKLDAMGCLNCHGTDAEPEPEKNPAKFGAWMLDPRDYYKSRNVAALLRIVNLETLGESKLLHKISGKVNHRGKDDISLDQSDIEELGGALKKWVYPFDVDQQ